MVLIERLPASSDSEDSSSSNSSNNSDDGERVDQERARILRRMELQPESDSDSEKDEPRKKNAASSKVSREEYSSSSDESSSDSKKMKMEYDDQWSDEEEEADEDSDDESSASSEHQSLSLQERLSQQEAKQSTMRTITSLKDQRERRSKAATVAKERLKGITKVQSTEAPIKKKKKSKHAPTEVSSRRRHNKTLNESGIGVEIGSNRYQPRDPRMSSLSGHYNADQHDHHYGFLQDVQAKEMTTLKLKIKSFNVTGQKGQRQRRRLGLTAADTPESLKEQLQHLQQTVAHQSQERLERNAKKSVKQKLQQRVQEGKGGVYFPKRAELKKMQMEAKVEEIEKTKGKAGLNKYLAKRRKKQKSVHAKKMRSSGFG